APCALFSPAIPTLQPCSTPARFPSTSSWAVTETSLVNRRALVGNSRCGNCCARPDSQPGKTTAPPTTPASPDLCSRRPGLLEFPFQPLPDEFPGETELIWPM